MRGRARGARFSAAASSSTSDGGGGGGAGTRPEGSKGGASGAEVSPARDPDCPPCSGTALHQPPPPPLPGPRRLSGRRPAGGRGSASGSPGTTGPPPGARACLPACLDHKPHRPQRAESALARPSRSGAGAGEVGRGAAWGLSGPEPPRQPLPRTGRRLWAWGAAAPSPGGQGRPFLRGCLRPNPAGGSRFPLAEVVRRGRQLPGEAKGGGGRELPMDSESKARELRRPPPLGQPHNLVCFVA